MKDSSKTIFGNQRILQIKLDRISENRAQPRLNFDSAAIERLADSINENGLIQPLTVRRAGRDYELIAGERRLRALRLLKRESAPCVVMEADEQKSAVLAIIENIQREDLNVFEQATAISALITRLNLSQSEVAARLNLSQSAVANKLRVLRLSEEERNIVIKFSLTERHARAVLRIGDEEKRKAALKVIAGQAMTVERAEKYVERVLKGGDGKTRLVFKDLRLFTNTINMAIETMRQSGVMASAVRGESDGFIEYTIRIPKPCVTAGKR